MSGAFFNTIANSAALRGLEFSLTKEGLWELFLAQDRQCAITGLNLVFSSLNTIRKYGIEQTASLDRIDSNIGYVPGNVWWVHKDINRMKQSFSYERFIELCILASKHHSALAC